MKMKLVSNIAMLATDQALCCFGADRIPEEAIDLSGKWSVQFKVSDKQKYWSESANISMIELPGSLQEQGLGNDVDEHTKWVGQLKDTSWLPNSGKQKDGSFRVASWLQPKKHYVGPAWCRRYVTIPESWAGKQAIITFERVHISTTAWWDDLKIGSENSLSTPHEYLLTNLKPGKHLLTVQIDNRLPASVGDNAHCVSDHTQTSWSGIIGKMEMRLVPDKWIDSIAVFPDVAGKRVRVRTFFEGKNTVDNLSLKFDFAVPKGAAAVSPVSIQCGTDNATETTIHLGTTIALWDEFNPNLYTISVSLLDKDALLQTKKTQFGMVEYKVEDQQFMVNGRPAYFRGTLDCAVFPLTGYPSTDLAYWKRVFTLVKTHGFNHIRYHSWFPPEVALQVADEVGVYLQCEHAWTTFAGNKEIEAYLDRETERVIERYGNHPSFAMHAYGNEPGGNSATGWLQEWVDRSRKLDEERRFYTSAAGWGNTPNSDYYDIMAGMRVYPWGAGLESTINKDEPSFLSDYRDTTQKAKDIPFINHEGGQWCVFPNFDEMKKYTGFLQPQNYEIFRLNLVANHMGDLAEEFLMASGRLQTICYKFCIEKLLRSPGCGGFQMLGLNDFPGQGTALVGAVDVFWDTKPYTSAEEYNQFSGVTVPLARFPKCVFQKRDKPSFAIDIDHYGPAAIENAIVKWVIAAQPSGEVVAKGVLKEGPIKLGLSSLADGHAIDLAILKAPAQYRFLVSIDGTSVENHWDFWVYPDNTTSTVGKVRIFRNKSEALKFAQTGETVLLVPEPTAIKSPAHRKPVLGFSTIFWNTAWAGRQPPTTMGILCDPKHPLFKQFPTEYHSNYQWWYLITKASQQPLLLDGQDASFKPIVRVIDDWYTNYRLGLVVEASIGKGRVLLTTIDISTDQPDQCVLNQFRKSVLDYMNSDSFAPKAELTEEQLGLMISDSP